MFLQVQKTRFQISPEDTKSFCRIEEAENQPESTQINPNHTMMPSDPLFSNVRITRETPMRICFVCLGNICRSPTAEGIFQHMVYERGLQDRFFIDSAGTSAWHVGEPANSKSQQIANKHGVKLLSRARAFDARDLEEFDLILAMDKQNHEDILSLDPRGSYQHKVRMMRDFDPQPDDPSVPDPYFGGMDGFQNVFDVLHRSSARLLDLLEQNVE
jgi:protein-tyrosine phosphatase